MDYEVKVEVKDIRGSKNGIFKPSTDKFFGSPDSVAEHLNLKYGRKKGLFEALDDAFFETSFKIDFLKWVIKNYDYVKHLIEEDKQKKIKEILK